MHTFLRDVTTLAAVAAAGGVALLKTFPPGAAAPPPRIAEFPAKPVHAPIRFAALVSGEAIHVRITSKGCFHDFDNLFVFSPAAYGADLALAQLRANLAPDAYFVAPDRLSASQLQELDALMEYYRAPRTASRAGCMTRDKVDVMLFRAGQMVAREYFTDDTCGFRAHNALTFDRLFHIARRPTALPP